MAEVMDGFPTFSSLEPPQLLKSAVNEARTRIYSENFYMLLTLSLANYFVQLITRLIARREILE